MSNDHKSTFSDTCPDRLDSIPAPQIISFEHAQLYINFKVILTKSMNNFDVHHTQLYLHHATIIKCAILSKKIKIPSPNKLQ